jgi:hypothetical protein
MELEGEAPVEGRWVGRVVGLNDVRADIAMMGTPDGHSRIELTKFHAPPAVRAEPESAPANTLGIRRIMFAVDDICVALRASSSDWPSSSAETSMGAARVDDPPAPQPKKRLPLLSRRGK